MGNNVVAFTLDDSVAENAPPDGMPIAGLPGRWKKDEPVLAEAIGFSTTSLRDAVKALGLPLKEVKVDEGDALDSFEQTPENIASAPLGVFNPTVEDEPIVEVDAAQLEQASEISERFEAADAEGVPREAAQSIDLEDKKK